MSLFEKDGEVYKNVPAGGHGGGVTSYATVKASEAEAAAFRAAQAIADEASNSPADEPAPIGAAIADDAAESDE